MLRGAVLDRSAVAVRASGAWSGAAGPLGDVCGVPRLRHGEERPAPIGGAHSCWHQQQGVFYNGSDEEKAQKRNYHALVALPLPQAVSETVLGATVKPVAEQQRRPFRWRRGTGGGGPTAVWLCCGHLRNTARFRLSVWSHQNRHLTETQVRHVELKRTLGVGTEAGSLMSRPEEKRSCN